MTPKSKALNSKAAKDLGFVCQASHGISIRAPASTVEVAGNEEGVPRALIG